MKYIRQETDLYPAILNGHMAVNCIGLYIVRYGSCVKCGY